MISYGTGVTDGTGTVQTGSLPPPVEASLVGFLEVLAERCRETTPHVESLSGRPPTSLAAFVAEQSVHDFLAGG